MTRPLATLVRPGWRPAVLGIIKGIHTAVFASMSLALGVLVWDGVRQRPAGRTLAAGTLIVAESAVYLSNDQVCPFTPLAEQIGAESGSVVDLFVPEWLARRIPIIGGTAMVLGLVLNLRAWLRRKGSASTLVG
jgi:hypothetical protein